ncbi:MAG: undecaprenyl-phosphate glucose phosphotransferase [Anaerolineae bacterium]
MFERYRRWLTVALMGVDIVLINVAFALAYWVRYELEWIRPLHEFNYIPFQWYLPVALVLTVILLIVYQLEAVYHQPRGASWLDEVYAIFKGTLIGIAIMIVIFFYYRPQFYSRLMFGYAGVLIVALLSLARLVVRITRDRLHKRGIGVDRVLIVGAGEVGRAIMRNIMARPELGYQVVGFVDDDPAKQKAAIGRFMALGNTDDIPRVVREHNADEVIISLPWMSHRKIMKIMAQCQRQGTRAMFVPDLFQMRLSQVHLDDINGIPLLGLKGVSIRGWNLAVKRAIDIVGSLACLILLSPLLLLIAMAIKLDSRGAVLFAQTRVGRGGKRFTLYKFRSMREGAEEEKRELTGLNETAGPIFKIRDDPRLTRLGKFFRRTSLDELPQLYNVLRGDMSLIGPRPPLPSEVELYEDWHMKRLEVAPGMSGLWQVSGRSELSFDEMVMLDIYYIENWSLGLDFKIMLRTIPTVIFANGAY